MINPLIIKNNGININRCIQYPGEFVITFCGGYHAGFNMGYNCAEAVNFACKNWIELGLKASFCRCLSDSVKIDMNSFVDVLHRKKILKKNKLGLSAHVNKQQEKSAKLTTIEIRSHTTPKSQKENNDTFKGDFLSRKCKRTPEANLLKEKKGHPIKRLSQVEILEKKRKISPRCNFFLIF